MSFSLTDEQIMIQTMAREFSRKVVALTAAERDQTKEFPSENLKKMGELGLMGMMVPFEYEGSGADTVSYVLALSEIAYSCASTAVVMSVHNSIVCESIYRFGTENQKERFLKRIEDPAKNWKFSMGDIEERKYWDDYQIAYQEAISATSKKHAPWYVIPADKKWFMRLAVSEIIVKEMKKLKSQFPKLSDEQLSELDEARKLLIDDSALKE